MWVPSAETAKQINASGFDEENLPGLRLPRNVRATADAAEAGLSHCPEKVESRGRHDGGAKEGEC